MNFNSNILQKKYEITLIMKNVNQIKMSLCMKDVSFTDRKQTHFKQRYKNLNKQYLTI